MYTAGKLAYYTAMETHWLSFGSFRPNITNTVFEGPQGRAIARSTPFHAYKTLREWGIRVSFVLNARSAFCGPPGVVVEGGGGVEQGEADSNSTSAWCGGRAAGHNSPWVIPGRVAWRGARMGRRMRHGGWWESGHGRQVSGGRWPDGASPPPDRRGVGAGRIGRRRGSYQGAWRGRVRGWWRPCSMVATRAGANAATIVVAAAKSESHGPS